MTAVPIILGFNPVSSIATATDMNGLLAIIAQQLTASINADVTFVLTGPTDPLTNITLLFFNTTQSVWKSWNTGSGKYLPITNSVVGDYKQSAISGDDIVNGWIVCDGRLLSAISGLSGVQFGNLQTLYGTSGTAKLPKITTPLSLAAMPANGAFSSIGNPDVVPPANTFGGLAFSNPVSQSEGQNLAGNCETLDGSTRNLQLAVAAIQGQAENVLAALNSGVGVVYTKVFVGFS